MGALAKFESRNVVTSSETCISPICLFPEKRMTAISTTYTASVLMNIAAKMKTPLKNFILFKLLFTSLFAISVEKFFVLGYNYYVQV